MKVFQINVVCGWGSTGRIAVDLHRLLQERGGEGMIAYGRREAPGGIPAFQIGSDSEVKLHALFSRVTDRQGFYSKGATKKLTETIREYDPDVIHLHNLHGYYLHLPTLFEYLKKAGKPVVWTLHDCWPFTGHCAYFEAAGCDRWKTGCHHCPQKKEYPVSLLLDASKKNYREKKALFTGVKNMTLVTPSQWLKKLAEEFFLGQYPVEWIPNGVDLGAFYPTYRNIKSKYNLQNKKIALGVASVWELRKGLADLCQLPVLLGEDWQVVIVGVSEEQRQALPPGVTGILRTESREELAALYTAAEVFVNPTWEDNFPTVNLEALACGTPVVTYRTGGSPEAITPSCGAAVERGDVSGLAERVKSLACTPEACVERARMFDSKVRYAQYLELYRQLTGIPAPPTGGIHV